MRINRSELAVPGIRKELFEKAANCAGDIIFLDLEDSVPLDEKEKARRNVIEAINDIDWKNKTVSVRVNSFETKFIEDDIILIFNDVLMTIMTLYNLVSEILSSDIQGVSKVTFHPCRSLVLVICLA